MQSSGWTRSVRIAIGLATVALVYGWAAPIQGHAGLDLQIALLTEQIVGRPGDAGLHLERGELHRVHGDWERAEADYRRARQLNPDLAAVDYCLGRMFLESDRPHLALAPVESLLAARPQHVEARVVRARALALVGRSLEAAQEFTRVIETSRGDTPPRPEHYLERARALAAQGGRHLDRAIMGLDDGIARLGPVVVLQQYAVDLELLRGGTEEALRRLDEMAMSRGRPESILARRGAILERAGRVDDARDAFLRARAAIRALPDTRRRTRAILDLEASVEDALVRLGEGDAR